MIKKVYFSGDGYISMKECVGIRKPDISDEEYHRVGELHHYRGKEFESMHTYRHKLVNPHLVKTLKRKTFEFEDNKINVIFGPNGCGKTTILKAIAAYCLCGDNNHLDGLTNVASHEPLSVMIGFDPDYSDEHMDKLLAKSIQKRAGNACEIDWDGMPVYYENIEKRSKTSIFGEMSGGGLFSALDEANWHMSRRSSGNNSKYLYNKIAMLVHEGLTPNDIITKLTSSRKYTDANDCWTATFNAAIRYYKKHVKEFDQSGMTILLDEIDKSLDISTVLELYTKVIPNLVKTTGVQVILVSHSPLILCKEIRQNPLYNIVSVMPKYTRECIKMLDNQIHY